MPRILLAAMICLSTITCSPMRAAESGSTERLLADIKSKVMTADYRADLDELIRQRDAAARLADDPALGYLALYWAGFASWRLAINGISHGMSGDDLKAHLGRATADFDASIERRENFADAHAAAALAGSWLLGMTMDRSVSTSERWAQATAGVNRRLARAQALAPDNPRVLWVAGGMQLFTPVQYGGDPKRAIQTYRRAIEMADDERPSNPALPDWGKPEALMAVAYAHLNQADPDLDSAWHEARAALRLRPDWSYVKDILLPQIEAERQKASHPHD